MTKTNKALLAKLMTNKEIAGNQKIVDFITSTLETAGTKGSKHPNYVDEKTGLEMKWCVRHNQYEVFKSAWTIPKSGRIDASCDVAVQQWKNLTKELRALEKQTKDITNKGDAEATQRHMVIVEAKKAERAGSYEYPTDVAKSVAETKESKKPMRPTRGNKK